MSLEDVKEEILDEAEQKAQNILEDASEHRNAVISDAEERAEEIIEQARQEAEKEAEALRRKELASARMEARKKRLAAREAVLDAAFQQFRDDILDLSEDEERDLIEAGLDRLSELVDIGTVHAPTAFEDLAEEYGEYAEFDGRGFIAESADGSRRFDMRFTQIADDVIEEHRKDVAEVLFE